MAALEKSYSPDWIGESGLDLEPGYCITFVRGVEPLDALRRVEVPEADLRTTAWRDLVAEAAARQPAYQHFPMAAFVIGESTVLVEENGFIGRVAEWNGPLSENTELVYVYQSPTSGSQELGIVRDGEEVAFLEGDAIEDCEAADEELRSQLLELAKAALKPWDEDGETPEEFDAGWVDLAQVACDYVGLRPLAADVGGEVLGAAVRIRT